MPADSDFSVSYRGRWVFPVAGEPIRDGVVEVRDGTIVSVGPSRGEPAIDLGDVALIPGLVNAHTHLEFSDLAAPIVPARPFTAWIRAVRACRAERNASAAEAIARGLVESAAAGTALVGEIATTGWEETGDERPSTGDHRRSSAAHPRAVVFCESIGPGGDRVESQLAAAREHVERFETIARSGSPRLRAGLSPHAPYSVHRELFEKLVSLAESVRVPLAMHLAETEAELEFLDRGTGALAEMLREFGFPPEALCPRGARPLDYLRRLAHCGRALVVHGNYLAHDEIAFLAAERSLTLVYCPRTHEFFGHAPHPWRQVLRLGGRVALGTDSRASNPDLSLWNELLFLRERFPDFDPVELLALATIHGAEALGDATCGAIEPGRRADLAVIGLSEPSADPWEALFHPAARVIATIADGVHR